MRPTALPDEALVVRGVQNLPENFVQATEGTADAHGVIVGVSVNAAPGRAVQDLTAANPQPGYPGIPTIASA